MMMRKIALILPVVVLLCASLAVAGSIVEYTYEDDGTTANEEITSYAPPTVSISADPEYIQPGASSMLLWTSIDADSCTIDQGIGEVDPNGSTTVSPTETTTYTITVTGPGGTAADSVQVTVTVPPEDTDHGLSADEQEGGGGLVGETIRTLNGNGVESRFELSIESPNRIGLSFNAFYNSRSDRMGSVGYGWTHTYDVNLQPAFDIGGKTYFRVIDQTGKAHYFQEETAGVYKGAFKDITKYFKPKQKDISILDQNQFFFPIWNISLDYKGNEFGRIIDAIEGEIIKELVLHCEKCGEPAFFLCSNWSPFVSETH